MEYNEFLDLLEKVCGKNARKKFHHNCLTLRRYGLPYTIQNIMQGFYWEDSKEGARYWNKIHQKMLGYELQEP